MVFLFHGSHWWACVHTRCSTSVKGLTEIKRPVNGPRNSCVKAWRTQAKEVFNRLLVNWTSTELGRVQTQIRRTGFAKGRRIKETTRSYQSASKAVFSRVCQQPSCCLSTGSKKRRILNINLMKWVQNTCRTRNSGTEQTCRENQRNLQLPNIFGYQMQAVPQYLPQQWSPPLVDAKQFNAGPLSQEEWEITLSSPYMPGEGGIHDGGHFKAADVWKLFKPRVKHVWSNAHTRSFLSHQEQFSQTPSSLLGIPFWLLMLCGRPSDQESEGEHKAKNHEDMV